MLKGKVYLYFGTNIAAAGFIYHRKQCEFQGAEFVNLADRSQACRLFAKLFSSRFYNSLINRFTIFYFFDQLLKFFVAAFTCVIARLEGGKFFVVSNDYVSIYFALLSSFFFGNKIHLCSHDLPWSFYNKRLSRRLNILQYRHLIKHFESYDFTTNEMRLTYEHVFGVKIYNYTQTLSGVDLCCSSVRLDAPRTLPLKRLRLLYLGNFRFGNELDRLFLKLNLEGIKVSVDVFSSKAPQDKRVMYKGFAKDVSSIDFTEYDFGIVPLSFAERDQILVRTSFPSKAAVYLKYGLPLLTVAPEYSALSRVVEQFPIGIGIEDVRYGGAFEFEIAQYRELLITLHSGLDAL
jgi:hypothetical protein